MRPCLGADGRRAVNRPDNDDEQKHLAQLAEEYLDRVFDPERRALHHTPPTTMPPTDDDEGPGADTGED